MFNNPYLVDPNFNFYLLNTFYLNAFYLKTNIKTLNKKNLFNIFKSFAIRGR